jgi:hypothetical protein
MALSTASRKVGYCGPKKSAALNEFYNWRYKSKNEGLDGLIGSCNIVIFTASSDQPMLKDIRDIGVKELSKKPFSLDDLIKLIEKYRPRV